jgi:hypothetical protein
MAEEAGKRPIRSACYRDEDLILFEAVLKNPYTTNYRVTKCESGFHLSVVEEDDFITLDQLTKSIRVVPTELACAVLSQLAAALYYCHYEQPPPLVDKQHIYNPLPNPSLRERFILHPDLSLSDITVPKNFESNDFNAVKLGGTTLEIHPFTESTTKYAEDVLRLGWIMLQLCTRRQTKFAIAQTLSREAVIKQLPARFPPELKHAISLCFDGSLLNRLSLHAVSQSLPVRIWTFTQRKSALDKALTGLSAGEEELRRLRDLLRENANQIDQREFLIREKKILEQKLVQARAKKTSDELWFCMSGLRINQSKC